MLSIMLTTGESKIISSMKVCDAANCDLVQISPTWGVHINSVTPHDPIGSFWSHVSHDDCRYPTSTDRNGVDYNDQKSKQ
jgi:hypothetical protein